MVFTRADRPSTRRCSGSPDRRHAAVAPTFCGPVRRRLVAGCPGQPDHLVGDLSIGDGPLSFGLADRDLPWAPFGPPGGAGDGGRFWHFCLGVDDAGGGEFLGLAVRHESDDFGVVRAPFAKLPRQSFLGQRARRLVAGRLLWRAGLLRDRAALGAPAALVSGPAGRPWASRFRCWRATM